MFIIFVVRLIKDFYDTDRDRKAISGGYGKD